MKVKEIELNRKQKVLLFLSIAFLLLVIESSKEPFTVVGVTIVWYSSLLIFWIECYKKERKSP